MTFPSARITVLLAVIAVVVAAAAGSGPPTSAQTDPIISVDAVSDAANTATTVGSIETCAVMFNNGVKDGDETGVDTIEVDVVIQGVTNISGFQGDLFYDPSILKVIAVDYNFLLASTGAAVLDLGNDTPDADGDFFMAAAVFSLVIVIGADGDGVLARVTLHAVGSGSSPLDLAYVKLSDADGNPIPPTDGNNFYAGPVNDASIVVDSSCSADSDGDGVADPTEGECGDAIDNDDNGLVNDGCPQVAATAESDDECTNAIDDDGDGFINDGCPGASETNACGSKSIDSASRPERVDGTFAGVDDDGDTVIDEALPRPGSDAFDCDGDGWTGTDEMYIFSATDTMDDQNPCGDALPPDMNDDRSVNILDVFEMFPFWLGVSDRHDLNADGSVNILDVFKMFPRWLDSCT